MLQQVDELGTAWSEIVNHCLPGRTALAAKNRYVVLERRADSSPGVRVTSEDTHTEVSLDQAIGMPPLGFDAATDRCVTGGNISQWNWQDASFNVSGMGMAQNALWTPDSFSDILCRNYMTLPPAGELSNQALALSTVDLPNHSVATGLEPLGTSRFDLDSDGFFPMRGSYLGSQGTTSLLGSDSTDQYQLDFDMEAFLGSTSIVMPQTNYSQSQDCGNTHYSSGL